MPHISVKLYPGRSDEQKQMLADEITKTLMSVLGSKREAISVGIEDIAKDDWAELVEKAEIIAKPEAIYKRSGT
ncbi:MAG: tautomerase family protein [Pseudomonadota bacterium]